MAKTTYQTYTVDTPLDTYRADCIRRAAMCAALAQRHPALADVAKDADAVLHQIDTRRAALQEAEDNQIRARAIEDVEKLDVVDVYTELRRTLSARKIDVMAMLPDAPSVLGRYNAKTFGERADQAVKNLEKLPDTDPVKTTLLPRLQQELGGFHEADLAEDDTRASLSSESMALTLYKTELSQAREAQLGAIQKALGDREKTAQFTLPWRKASKGSADAQAEGEAEGTTPEAPAAPKAPDTPPKP